MEYTIWAHSDTEKRTVEEPQALPITDPKLALELASTFAQRMMLRTRTLDWYGRVHEVQST
jgi:hypothetical protein